MQCTQCGDFKTTVGDIRACQRCTQANDGTAALLPSDLPDSATIGDAIALKPGLANRFVSGDHPDTAAEAIEEQQAAAKEPETPAAEEHATEAEADRSTKTE